MARKRNGNDRLCESILSVKESPAKELHNFRDEMTARFDAQAARLDGQGGMVRAATCGFPGLMN
jgi:hypothetical protein